MSVPLPPTKAETAIPPGEGERRAQRGYVPQYQLASRVIYQAIASDELEWVGLADRGAGAFDDLVLGFRNRVEGYQVKTSQHPAGFSLATLLLGAEKLLVRMATSYRMLKADYPLKPIEVSYVCEDFARREDRITSGKDGSSAQFLQTHGEFRRTWTLKDWSKSQFSEFVELLRVGSGLDDVAFAELFSGMRFLTGGEGGMLGLPDPSQYDWDRIQRIAALLPRLVADKSDRDRWPRKDLLARLGWRDPTELRHQHDFPVDALYKPNDPTITRLQKILSSTRSGYVSLIGPPGSGKSTLLAASLIPTPNATIVRYLAFLPGEGHGLGRAEAYDFLHDVIKRLKQQGLGRDIVPGKTLPELRLQFERLLGEASARSVSIGLRTLIVVDGLDHVPREEDPDRAFLSELPLPQSVPPGVIFVLGSQKLDGIGLPPSVRDEASSTERMVLVEALSREAVFSIADRAAIHPDIDRQGIFARSKGHPLSTRYILSALLSLKDVESCSAWLRDGPEHGGDVDSFYQRAWRDLECNPKAREVLAFLSITEGIIRPKTLDVLVDSEATNEVWRVAGHLLARNRVNGWSVFHNSFRLFLRSRIEIRFGEPDTDGVTERFRKLAEVVKGASNGDPQRWMDLRYLARAGEMTAVADSATPERFRSEFVDQRDLREIRQDISFAFEAARVTRRPLLLVNLVLIQHEIRMRAGALGEEFFESLLEIGELDAAAALVDAAAVDLPPAKAYDLVDAYLDDGQQQKARDLFFQLEPLDRLLGAVPTDRSQSDDVLFAWARRASRFREREEILLSISRVSLLETFADSCADIDSLRTRLRLNIARALIKENPTEDLGKIIAAFEVNSEDRCILQASAALTAAHSGLRELALERLKIVVSEVSSLPDDWRRALSGEAVRFAEPDLARALLAGLEPPSLNGLQYRSDGSALKAEVAQIFDHARLTAELQMGRLSGAIPDDRLYASYQATVEELGFLVGSGGSRSASRGTPIRLLKDVLDILQYADVKSRPDSSRWILDRVMDQAVDLLFEAARSVDAALVTELVREIDFRLSDKPGRCDTGAVRRAFARHAFGEDRDIDNLRRRLEGSAAGHSRSPQEQIAELASTAQLYFRLGFPDEAKAILRQVHQHSLGISEAPKRDPQYLLWEDIFSRACVADPDGRVDRLKFMAKLLSGMSDTEGYAAGHRLAPALLVEASKQGASWAARISDFVEENHTSSWTDISSSVISGVVSVHPELAVVASIIFSRLTLPFAEKVDSEIVQTLLQSSPAANRANLVEYLAAAIKKNGRAKRTSIEPYG